MKYRYDDDLDMRLAFTLHRLDYEPYVWHKATKATDTESDTSIFTC